MRALLWIFAIIAALLWSGLAWMLHAAAGAGGAWLATWGPWLGVDPTMHASITAALGWLGPAAQWIVVAFWLVGLVVLLLFPAVAGRLLAKGGQLAGESVALAGAMRRGERPTLDPMLRDELARRVGRFARR